MKVLYIIRLFSGLEKSLIENKWRPTGVPTIFKALEGFENEFDLHVVLSRKKNFSSLKKRVDKKLKLSEFRNEIIVINFFGFKFFGQRLNKIINEFFQVLSHLFLVFKVNPEIIYIDNSNILSGAILSRIFQKKVCFRVMGVNPVMKNYYSKSNTISKIFKFLYRSPFNLIVGTQDGSGIEYWFEKALNKSSQKQIFINGVNKSLDHKEDNNDIITKKNKINVCFIGKMEEHKGAELFFEAALNYLDLKDDFYFIMVGNGSLFKTIKEKIKIYRVENNFNLIQYLGHNNIYKLLDKVDLYVSLNKYGNLSNTNLESIFLKKPMIILTSELETDTDRFVDEFLPNNCVIRIERNNVVKSLINCYKLISSNPNKLNELSEKLEPISNNLISWEERIQLEINLIKNLND